MSSEVTRRTVLKAAAGAVVAAGMTGSAGGAETNSEDLLTLWYREPAVKWTEALPVGNGRLGAMVFGGPVDQVIVVRLTADRPGRISFSFAFDTPQKAEAEVEAPDTLVLRGSNRADAGIPGKLKFEGRVRVMASGGTTAPGEGGLT